MRLKPSLSASTSLPFGLLLATSSPLMSQQAEQKVVNKHGEYKKTIIIKKNIKSIKEKSLPLFRGARGEVFYEFKLDPHEKISFKLEGEPTHNIDMQLITPKNLSTHADIRMQALNINESLKHAPRNSFTFNNTQDKPYKIILQLV